MSLQRSQVKDDHKLKSFILREWFWGHFFFLDEFINIELMFSQEKEGGLSLKMFANIPIGL